MEGSFAYSTLANVVIPLSGKSIRTDSTNAIELNLLSNFHYLNMEIITMQFTFLFAVPRTGKRMSVLNSRGNE